MGCQGVPPNSTLKLTAARQLGPRGALVPEAGPPQLSFVVRHPSRSEALDPTVTELLPNDTQPPTDTDHQVLPSLSDPNNIRRTMNEALNKYGQPYYHNQDYTHTEIETYRHVLPLFFARLSMEPALVLNHQIAGAFVIIRASDKVGCLH